MRHRTSRLTASVLASAVLLVGACGADDDGGEDRAEGSTTTTTSTAGDAGSSTTTSGQGPAPTEPATTLQDSEASGRSELEDGRHFGYWKSFEIGDSTAFNEFDLAYFLTGDDAEQAAQKKGEEVTNDYFIVNDNPKLRTLVVRGNAKVTVLAGDSGSGPETEASNVADFAVDRHEDAGFWVTVQDGLVTAIEEQYQP